MENETLAYEQIESFILNNKELANIHAFLSKFNPIKVMGMEQVEIRHSKILGWLLDPKGNHGLGDDFLTSFLAEAMRGETIQGLRSLDISSSSLVNASTKIEWNRIDIFVECPDQQWAFIIENKIRAKQQKDQLTRYRNLVKERFPEYSVLGIFLTVEDEAPNDQGYCHIRFPSVVAILQNLLDQRSDSLSEKIANFIKYYLEIIRDLTHMNTDQDELEQLARRIYQENKQVLDYLFEHGRKDEFEYAIETFMNPESPLVEGHRFHAGKSEFEYLYSTKNWYRFLPTSWIDTLGYTSKQEWKSNNFRWKGCENWFPYPIVCWVELYGDAEIRLMVEVGPLGDHEQRATLINAIKNNFQKSKFQRTATDPNKKFSRFFSIKRKIDDVQDYEKMKEIIEKLLAEEFKDPINQIGLGLIEFMKNNSRPQE